MLSRMICGQFPSLGQPLADDHVVQADHGAFDIGDVAAKQIRGFDDSGEAFGQDRIQSDLAEIVQQSADEGFGRPKTRFASVGRFDCFAEKFGAAGRGKRMLPELGAGKLRLILVGAGKCLEDRNGQDGAAKRFETEKNDGPLECDGIGANARIGAMNELKDSSGQGGIAADQCDDLGDRRLFIGGDLQNARGDRRQCREAPRAAGESARCAGAEDVRGNARVDVQFRARTRRAALAPLRDYRLVCRRPCLNRRFRPPAFHRFARSASRC